jgi:hypothetical protein
MERELRIQERLRSGGLAFTAWEIPFLSNRLIESDAKFRILTQDSDQELEVFGRLEGGGEPGNGGLWVFSLGCSLDTHRKKRVRRFEEFRKKERCDHLTALSVLVKKAEAGKEEREDAGRPADFAVATLGVRNERTKITRNMATLETGEAAT